MAQFSPSPAAVYADTSFLCSLYLRDANTGAATGYVLRKKPAFVFTLWQRCELRNAVRLAVARGNATPDAARQALADIDQDARAGDLLETHLVWPDVFAIAESLSAAHTMDLAVRTLDLLHVAAALSLGLEEFVTCDARQETLATTAGLRRVSLKS